MTGQLELWEPGWEIEPCDTADPDEQAHVDLHARHKPIPADAGRPPGRPDAWRHFKPVTDVPLEGELL